VPRTASCPVRRISWRRGRVEITDGAADVKFSKAIVSADKTSVRVYNGTARAGNKGGSVELTQMTMTGLKTPAPKKFIQPPSDWEAACLASGRMAILVDADAEPGFLKQARNAFDAVLAAYNFTGETDYSWLDKQKEHDITIKFKAAANTNGIPSVNGYITNDATSEVIGIIDIQQKPSSAEGSAMAAAYQSILVKAAQSSGLKIQEQDEKWLKYGTRLFIEASGFNKDEYNEIKAILEGINGISSIKYSDFYGQKGVYEANYIGSGFDLAEILKQVKLKNSSINVWKYSKNVVKLSKI